MSSVKFIVENAMALLTADRQLYDSNRYLCPNADYILLLEMQKCIHNAIEKADSSTREKLKECMHPNYFEMRKRLQACANGIQDETQDYLLACVDNTLDPEHSERVQACVHGLLRTIECRFHKEGILSPLYHGKNGVMCNKNETCPYVIAYSMYLWLVTRVGFEFPAGCPNGSKKHERESFDSLGSGCSFKHVREMRKEDGTIVVVHEYMDTRKEVFDILDSYYAGVPYHETHLFYAFGRVYEYYFNFVLRNARSYPVRNRGEEAPAGPHVGALFSMNLTANAKGGRVDQFRSIIIMDDSIFASLQQPQTGFIQDEDDQEVQMSSNNEAFVKLPKLGPNGEEDEEEEMVPEEEDNDL